VANRQALHDRIDAVLGALTKVDVLARLDAADIANAELRDMRSFSAHPQLTERDRWRDVAIPGGETARSLIPPVSAQSYSARMDAVPALGEHTDAILAEFGVTD
ncbi:MAG: hypothetical protein RLZ72_310, partial [Actinomycetota bacterium]